MRALLPPRSNPTRDRTLAELGSRRWDLLVVGGGITGVAVARDAALRGLSTALIERQDFAFGTSSRSSRLIHGGLRYLANMDFALVREGLVERKLLLDNAPGLVYPVRFVYPVYRGDPDPVWKVDLGVRLYEALSMGYGLGGSRRLRRRGLERTVPYLRHEGLKGGISYFDAAAHDTRLTLSVALSARRAGAHLVSRCGAVRLRGGGDEPVTGAVVEDSLSGDELNVEARAVALCCGPWQKLYRTTPIRLRTARGTHLSLRCRRLPLDCYVALRSPRDGRLAFAMPLDRYLVLGTTDDDDTRRPGEVSPTADDSEYLLELANHAFPAVDVEAADIAGAWAGLRPLVADGSGENEASGSASAPSGSASADKLSRRHLVTAGAPGLWILTGGKLTTHRLMAEDCLDAIAPWLERQGVAVGPCRTREQPLLAGSIERGGALLRESGESADRIERLVRLYGARLESLAELVLAATGEPRTGDRVLDAQIELAVEEEWALSLDDLLLRRIGPGALDLRTTWAAATRVGGKAGELLGWSDQERDTAIDQLRAGLASDLVAAGAPPLDPPPTGT